MTVLTIPPAVAVIGGLMPSIGTAKDPPPAAIDTAQLPCLYTLTGEAEYEWIEKLCFVTRMFRVQVAVVPTNQATPETRETRIRPLIVEVRNYLAARPQLGLVSGVQEAKVLGDSGPAILPEYDGKYLGFEVRLQVTYAIERAFAAGE